jgi:Major Facilitator Superfamily
LCGLCSAGLAVRGNATVSATADSSSEDAARARALDRTPARPQWPRGVAGTARVVTVAGLRATKTRATIAKMLRHPALMALLASEVISSTGALMTALALPWFVLASSGSASHAAYVVGAEVFAYALLGIPSGTVAARLGARRTMVICNVALAVVVALIPVLHWVGVLSFPILLLLAFASGAISTPYGAAQEVVLPELLGEDERIVAKANAAFQSATRLTYLAGPALAGLLISFLGAPMILVIDAATYLVAFVLLGLFIPQVATPPAHTDLVGVLAGVRYLWRDRLLRTLTIAQAGSQMAFQALSLALPVLAFVRYDHNALLAGLFLAAWGLGALAGGLIAYRIVSRFDPLVMGAAAWFAYALPLWALVLHLPAGAVFVPLVLAGVGNGLRNPPLAAIRVLRVPASLRPKTLTASGTIAWLGGAVALGGIGIALRALGIAPVFALIAAISTASAVAFVTAVERSRLETRDGQVGVAAVDSGGQTSRPPSLAVNRRRGKIPRER